MNSIKSTLLVEDDEAHQELFGTFIKQNIPEVKIETVDSLKAANEKISQDQYDILLLDLNLKDSKGLNTLKNVREQYKGPLLILTSNNEKQTSEKSIQMGAEDFLPKDEADAKSLFRAMFLARERHDLALKLETSHHRFVEFNHALAHDFRAYISYIIHYSDFIKQNPVVKEQDEVMGFVQQIQESANFMLRTMTDLLDLAKFSNSKISANEIVDLDYVFSYLDLIFADSFKEQGGKFYYELETNNITGNQDQLIRLFQNLISNSIKYKKEDQAPFIHVHYKEEKNFYTFLYEDNGQGIEKSKAKKVFNEFYRVNKNDPNGTGIGLSICQSIVENHGGSIDLESDLGKGCRFTIRLRKTAS